MAVSKIFRVICSIRGDGDIVHEFRDESHFFEWKGLSKEEMASWSEDNVFYDLKQNRWARFYTPASIDHRDE